MSKAAKQSIFILIILLAGGLGFAGYTLLDKQKIEQQKISLEHELQSSQEREKKGLVEIKGLREQLDQEKGEKTKVKNMIGDFEKRIEGLLAQISEITGERDKWQTRLEEIKKERDALLAKVEELNVKVTEKPQVVYEEKIVYKEKEPAPVPAPAIAAAGGGAAVSDSVAAAPAQTPPEAASAQTAGANEKYVAQLLKEKTALEVEIEKLKGDLSKRSLEIVDLKQANETLRIDLEAARQEKGNIADSIREKEDVINRLSLELARAKNDKQFAAQKVDQMVQDNMQLHQEIKKLSTAKMALEKSIVQLTQDKDSMNRKLEQAEAALQNKIGEIWDVKDSLDRSFKAVAEKPSAGNEVELPPIIVSGQAPSKAEPYTGQGAAPAPVAEDANAKPGFEGRVMSVNEQNHFVIVDIGAKRGLQVGDTLFVYRDSEYLARLEVIQVRPDIAAADLKEQWAQVRTGDTVR